MMTLLKQWGEIIMPEPNRRYRAKKSVNQPLPKRRKGDKLLNYLIALVTILIIAVASFIFSGNSTNKNVAHEPGKVVKEKPTTQPNKNNTDSPKNNGNTDVEKKEETTTKDQSMRTSTTVITQSNDPNVEEVIEDSNWKPYTTKQKESGGVHASSYVLNSVDWTEKMNAMSTVTSIPIEDMNVWFMKNGGSVDSSIGTIYSKDKTKKYRVTVKWAENKGWLPTKVEKLKQIKGLN